MQTLAHTHTHTLTLHNTLLPNAKVAACAMPVCMLRNVIMVICYACLACFTMLQPLRTFTPSQILRCVAAAATQMQFVTVCRQTNADVCLVWFHLVYSHYSRTSSKVSTQFVNRDSIHCAIRKFVFDMYLCDEYVGVQNKLRNGIGKLFQLHFIYRLLPGRCHQFISLKWLFVSTESVSVYCCDATNIIYILSKLFLHSPPCVFRMCSVFNYFRLFLCRCLTFDFFLHPPPMLTYTKLTFYWIHQNRIFKKIKNWKTFCDKLKTW